MKCVTCGEEAEYVQSGMSLCEKHFKTQQVENRDVDLVKVQIYADSCHAFLTSRLSFLFVVFSLVGVFYGLYYQGLFESNILKQLTGLLLVGLILVLFVFQSIREKQRYDKDWKRIAGILEAVNKGKGLPPLDKLNEWKENED
jgi:hypothetical protein